VIIEWVTLLAGMYLILEAVISLFWKFNDKWFWAQVVRGSRIIIGVFVVWLSFVI
jgi:hypothetical protein